MLSTELLVWKPHVRQPDKKTVIHVCAKETEAIVIIGRKTTQIGCNLALALSLMLVIFLPSGSRAETIDCTAIESVPVVIHSQGVYCFVGNISTDISTGNAIEIATNNVTIDLNGWKLGGLAAGTDTQANGIYADGRFNVTIRNGTIRGFHTAIKMQEGQGHLIEDVRAEQSRVIGLSVRSNGSLLRRNQIVDTGGSTLASVQSVGLEIGGTGVRVMENEVSGVSANDSSSVYGIMAAIVADTIIQDNRVTGVLAEDAKTVVGIVLGLGNGIIERNVVASFGGSEILDNGILFGWGGSGGYRGNVVGGAGTSYSGGVNLGDNDEF